MEPSQGHSTAEGPKDDGTYVVEFQTAEGEVLAISIPRSEAHGAMRETG